MNIWIAFFGGVIVGVFLGVIVISLLCMAGRPGEKTEGFRPDPDFYPGEPADGYHPGSLSDPRD
jgi:hypothetical protein